MCSGVHWPRGGSSTGGQRRAMGANAWHGEAAVSRLPLLVRRSGEPSPRATLLGLRGEAVARPAATSGRHVMLAPENPVYRALPQPQYPSRTSPCLAVAKHKLNQIATAAALKCRAPGRRRLDIHARVPEKSVRNLYGFLVHLRDQDPVWNISRKPPYLPCNRAFVRRPPPQRLQLHRHDLSH